VSGATGVPPKVGVKDDVIVAPFISHSASAPESPRQSTSVQASALKLLIEATVQLASGTTGVPPDVTRALPPIAPFWLMSQKARPPLVLRHMMSLTPLLLKSGGAVRLNRRPRTLIERS
jgi:hypothetical protein